MDRASKTGKPYLEKREASRSSLPQEGSGERSQRLYSNFFLTLEEGEKKVELQIKGQKYQFVSQTAHACLSETQRICVPKRG